jgi:hypothetical protein
LRDGGKCQGEEERHGGELWHEEIIAPIWSLEKCQAGFEAKKNAQADGLRIS